MKSKFKFKKLKDNSFWSTKNQLQDTGHFALSIHPDDTDSGKLETLWH
jgi:hypothetical protein